MPDRTLTTGADPVLRWSRKTPHAIAVMENNVSHSYSILAKNLAQAAKMLTMAGLCPGMIVGIECEVRYLHLVLILACEVLGAVRVMMEPSDQTSDSALLPHCGLLYVQTNNDHLSKYVQVIQLSREYVHEMLRQSVDDNDLQMLGRAYPTCDIVRTGKTSGITGHLTFMGYTRDTLRSAVELVAYLLKFDETHQNFIAFYSFIMMRNYSDTMSAFRFGATVIYSMGWEIAASIRKLPACHTFLLVGAAADLLSSEQFREGRLGSCSLCVGGGFVLNALRARLRQTVTTDLQIAYSTNKTRDITTDDGDGPGTVLPDVLVRIVDNSGRDKQPGQSGRVLVRMPRMASSYLWNDAETKAHFADGWFLTSDTGFMPQPGKLTLPGRADEMINLGGLKFAPYPIEEQIRAIDGVIDAVLIGSQNAAGLSKLHVFIELNHLTLDRTIGGTDHAASDRTCHGVPHSLRGPDTAHLDGQDTTQPVQAVPVQVKPVPASALDRR